MRKLVLVTLIILSVIIISAISFEDVFADALDDTRTQYKSPTVIFDVREYYQNEEIKITCVSKHPDRLKSIDWIIQSDVLDKRIKTTHQPADYSFSLDIIGEYVIKCRTNHGDAHDTSNEWVPFSIVSRIIDSANPSKTYDPPTIEFDEDGPYTLDEIITATCTPDDSKDTTSIVWIIANAKNDKVSEITQQSNVYSFQAKDYPEGNYDIRCETHFEHGNSKSEWTPFSLVSGIVDSARPPHTYDPPTIEFEEKAYTFGDTITATCIPDTFADTTNIIWFIRSTDDPTIRYKYQHESVDYSFPADRYEEGNYSIKCRTNYGNGHATSIGGEFSITSGLVIELAAVPEPVNFVHMDYDQSTKEVIIYWDFGDNPDRESCNSKTVFHQENYTSINPIDYDPNGDYLNFEGINKNTFGNGSLLLKDTDLTNSEIDCSKGSLTFNIESDHPSNFTDEFSLFMTFFEVIKIDQRSNPQYDDITSNGINVLNRAVFITTSLTILEESPCGNYSKGDKWNSIELIHDTRGSILTTFSTVDGCYIEYEYGGYSTTQTIDEKKTGGGGSPPPPPTFGKDKNYNQIVTDGFCFNGNCVDVDKLWTEFPLIVANVGEQSNITVKGYNPNGGVNGIEWIQVILGLKEAGTPLSYGEVIAVFYLDDTEIDKVEITDKQNLIGNYTVSTDIVKCSDEYSSDCIELSFDFIPRDQLVNNVVAADIMNNHRSSSTNFFNDGVEFHGESMNEPLISYVSASKGGAFYPQDRGQVELQLVSYHESLWQDEFGHLWEPDNNKSFVIISDVPVPIREPDLMWSAMTRINSNFGAMIIHEQEKAILIFDASKLISTPAESWTYDLPKSDAVHQAELDIRIALEADRAEKELQAYFDYIYAGKVQD